MNVSIIRRCGCLCVSLVVFCALAFAPFQQASALEASGAQLVAQGLSASDTTPGVAETAVVEPRYNGVSISSRAKVYGTSWSAWAAESVVGDVNGKGLRAMRLKLAGLRGISGHIRYQTYARGAGWTTEVSDGKTTASARYVEAVKIKLSGTVAKHYDVIYRANVSGKGWCSWGKNGAVAGVIGKNMHVNAVQIQLSPKTEEACGKATSKAGVFYEARFSSTGWQAWKRDGAVAGKKASQLRGLAVRLDAGNSSGGVKYRAYSNKNKWQDWKADGRFSGVPNKQLEAMQIKLTGKLARSYDVYYRAYAHGVGWLDWAANGATSGSTGYGVRIGAFQVKLVKKGVAAPGSTKYPTVNLMETTRQMNGIDIASWQAGINIYKVKADFIIVKATEGTTYVNPYFKKWADDVLASGKQLGIYHFATDKDSAKAQADFFYKTVKPYIGRAVLFLDWENTSYSDVMSKGPSFAKKWLDRVHKRTGVRPLIYINQSTTWNYNWASVAKSYKLWLAQYLYVNMNSNGYLKKLSHWDINHWSSETIYQYSSTGKIKGYSGNLDLNKFYGSVLSWKKLARKS